MYDHRKKLFYLSLPKPISTVALILAISGHFYILHLIGHITVADSKNRVPQNEVVARLLSEKTDKVAHRVEIKKQNERSLTKPEIHSLPTPPSLDETPIKIQPADEFYYFKSDELSQKPQVINDLPADFFLPDIAELPEPLIMTLRISNEGMVDEVFIAGDIADSQTLLLITTAFKTMTFAAAQIAGIAVPSEMRIEVWKNSNNQDALADK